VPRLSFFIGKGGVGKTTVSSAYAVRAALAQPQKSVLLISTDPAHSTADIFQVRLADAPQRVPLPGRGRLFLWQINAQKQFAAFLKRQREAILSVIESGTFFSRREIEPLLDTTLPGMAEVSALLALHDLLESRQYDEVVIDTAPIGHTIRLFQLPEHLSRFVNFLEAAASRDRLLAERFGGSHAIRPNPIIAEWQKMVGSVRDALSGDSSRLVLVTTSEKFSLNESARAAEALQAAAPELKISEIVLNRAVRHAGQCAVCRKNEVATRGALAFLRRNFAKTKKTRVLIADDSGDPIMGARPLQSFAEHVFAGKKLDLQIAPPRAGPELKMRRVKWPRLDVPLSLTVGKGGVGKTTVSAALAFHARQTRPRRPVIVCSTDPAPSLGDVFRQAVGNRATAALSDPKLRALEMDSVAEFRQWADDINAKIESALSSEDRGVHLDMSFDRRIFSALLDIVPPGVDEIFAIFRIQELLTSSSRKQDETVVIDMAPTGHALELLRTPDRLLLWSRLLLKSLAAHRTLPLARDAAVEIASVSRRTRELAESLRDRGKARLWTVMLPEPLPDRETARLLRSTDELKAPPGPVFVNRVLLHANKRHCARCERKRAWQLATLAGLRRRLRNRAFYVIRNFPSEIAGRAGLTAFTRELWQLEGTATRSVVQRRSPSQHRGR